MSTCHAIIYFEELLHTHFTTWYLTPVSVKLNSNFGLQTTLELHAIFDTDTIDHSVFINIILHLFWTTHHFNTMLP